MEKKQHKHTSSLDTSWSKLENCMSLTPVSTKTNSRRPASGRMRCSSSLSYDFPGSLPESQRNSRKKISSISFLKRLSSGASFHSNSRSQRSIPSPLLAPDQLTQLYNAKCKDLKIDSFPEQEKRFYSFCQKNFCNRTFNMMESGIGLESSMVISSILQNSSSFSYIKLGKNILQDKGCVEIAKGIHKNLCIVHLDLSSNELTQAGLKEMNEFLVNNESIVSLDLSSHQGLHRNRLGPEGAASLKKILLGKNLISFLNIAGTGIGDEGLENLSSGIFNKKSLVSLNLSSNSLTCKALSNFGSSVLQCGLARLELRGNLLGNEGAEAISKILVGHNSNSCVLEHLDISDNEITTRGMAKIFFALTSNHFLKYLNLSCNCLAAGLSDDFARFIMENSGVKTLDLSFCNIKTGALTALPEALPKNRNLENLILSFNQLCDSDVEMICAGLSRNLNLLKLNLNGNRIKDRGGKFLVDCLEINSTLEELYLKNNDIRDQSGQLFENVCRKNNNLIELNLEYNPISIRHVMNIKNCLKKNRATKSKRTVPNLKRRISHLSKNSDFLEKVKKNLSIKREEYGDIMTKVNRNNKRYQTALNDELEKYKVLNEEYKKLCEKSNELSATIENIYEVIGITKAKEEKIISENNEKIGIVASDTRNLEKTRANLKKEIAGKKQKYFFLAGNIDEKAENAEVAKRIAQNNLEALKQDLEQKYLLLESFKSNKKNKKKNEEKNYLATEKLASTKKTVTPPISNGKPKYNSIAK